VAIIATRPVSWHQHWPPHTGNRKTWSHWAFYWLWTNDIVHTITVYSTLLQL